MGRRRPPKFSGLLPVAKQSGPTSHDVVDKARRALGERRIGHTGTLDPMAEGLLLLCVGHATRLQQYLLDWAKTYHGVVRLGFSTTTYDREGEATDPRGDVPELDRETLAGLEHRFSGAFDQVPPPYSAKKVDGKKAYELARSGQKVEIEAKPVTVHDLSLRSDASDEIDLTVNASTGFYVRSLAHDMGGVLGCGGYLHHLRRLAIGPYTVEDALPQQALDDAADSSDITSSSTWVPVEKVRLPFPELTINGAAVDRFVHGQEIVVFRTGPEGVETGDRVVVRSPEGLLVGIGIVAAVLARGRTLNVRPSMVLADGGHPGRNR
ncbi:MAG: tRNA pseudouridine(55) synthase TruB [Thermoanaerobaculales bacterium]|jgi:tRNA pseudouridine55 synthase|nr:tRNA pseudouridine(55) synthase TruB [Thermoanaerobaculales bacterium]